MGWGCAAGLRCCSSSSSVSSLSRSTCKVTEAPSGSLTQTDSMPAALLHMSEVDRHSNTALALPVWDSKGLELYRNCCKESHWFLRVLSSPLTLPQVPLPVRTGFLQCSVVRGSREESCAIFEDVVCVFEVVGPDVALLVRH